MRSTNDGRARPWQPPAAGPRCPDCGRAVHRLPDGRLLSLAPLVCGWTFAPHRCLSRGVRYPLRRGSN